MRHWPGGSDARRVLVAAGTRLAAREEMIAWVLGTGRDDGGQRRNQRQQTNDEVAAFVSGAAEMASAGAGTSLTAAGLTSSRRGTSGHPGRRGVPRRLAAWYPCPRRRSGCASRWARSRFSCRSRTTMRYDRVRASPGRHATDIVATYVAGATQQELTAQRELRLAGPEPARRSSRQPWAADTPNAVTGRDREQRSRTAVMRDWSLFGACSLKRAEQVDLVAGMEAVLTRGGAARLPAPQRGCVTDTDSPPPPPAQCLCVLSTTNPTASAALLASLFHAVREPPSS